MSANTTRARNRKTYRTMPNRIFLIGPMGVGKTTIGHQLAQSLDKSFCDSDKIIEQRTGANIPLIFELEGEDGFRKRETAALDELTHEDNIVLATGGGAVLRQENRDFLKKRGYIIYLKAELEQLMHRTAKDRNRPLLQTEDPRAKLAEILAQRTPIYESLADLIIDTGKQNTQATVKKILRILGRRSQNRSKYSVKKRNVASATE